MVRLQIALPLLLVYLALSHSARRPAAAQRGVWRCCSAGSARSCQAVRAFDWRRSLPFLFGILRYAGVVIVDMFKSAYNVARASCGPETAHPLGHCRHRDPAARANWPPRLAPTPSP